MKTDVNGCSTTAIGEEQIEWFTTAGGKEKVQYDYRHTNGKLFSCVAQTLEGARSRRDEWLHNDCRVPLSSVTFGKQIRLKPDSSAPIYTVYGCQGFGEPITLETKDGKFVEKPYLTMVYEVEGE